MTSTHDLGHKCPGEAEKAGYRAEGEHLESTIGMGSVEGDQKKRVNKFLLNDLVLQSGNKGQFSFPINSLRRNTFTKINLFLKCCKPVSITVICSLLAGTVMYLLPSCSGCYSDRFFCRLTIANDPTIQVKRLF